MLIFVSPALLSFQSPTKASGKPQTTTALVLGISSINVGTAQTQSGSSITLSVPFTANLNPAGATSGSGTLVLPSPVISAALDAGSVSQSSSGAFSIAHCDFYASSASLGTDGLVACTGDIVGSADTGANGVTFSAVATCVACSYTAGEAFNE
jgi:hypothetical protein